MEAIILVLLATVGLISTLAAIVVFCVVGFYTVTVWWSRSTRH